MNQPTNPYAAFAVIDNSPQQTDENPYSAFAREETWADWLSSLPGRAVDAIKGEHDPRYKDIGSVFEQFKGELSGPTATAALGGADDDAMSNIIEKQLGDKFIRREKDANGYDVFVTAGPNGEEQKGYINKPGLDSEDIWRNVYGAAPYLLSGGAAGAALRGTGIGARMLGQFAANSAPSVAGDFVNQQMGSGQAVDPVKAGVMGTAGAVAEPVAAIGGALWRRFVTEPGLIDKGTGQLTQKGIEAARAAGVDDADITPDFARQFAKTLSSTKNPAQAATRAGLDSYGIPATRGQLTKDPYLLTQEEGMRRRLYGEQAQSTMQGFDRSQGDAIRFAALGDDGRGTVLPQQSVRQPGQGFPAFRPKQGIGQQINPMRQPGAIDADRMPSTLGSNVQSTLQTARQNARQQESSLWTDGATQLAPTQEALRTLPDVINPKIADIPIDTVNTPTAAGMRDHLVAFMEGKAPETVNSPFKSAPVKTVDQMRRRLFEASKSAVNGQDRTASKALYDGFNDWISEAASQKLLAGDSAGALQLAKARGFTREVRNIFEPRASDGTMSPAGRRIATILDPAKADSGEAVIQTLFGSRAGSSPPSAGTISTLRQVKTALDRFAPGDAGTQAWNDIRLAYWSRLITSGNGELVGPTAMLNNIKSAIANQRSVLNTLYAPDEQRQIRNFVQALEHVSYKPPNASGSGYAAASFAKDGLLNLLDAFGIGTPARAVLERLGITDSWNAAAAKQAIRQVPRPRPRNLAPLLAAGASALQQSQPSLRGGMGPRYDDSGNLRSLLNVE